MSYLRITPGARVPSAWSLTACFPSCCPHLHCICICSRCLAHRCPSYQHRTEGCSGHSVEGCTVNFIRCNYHSATQELPQKGPGFHLNATLINECPPWVLGRLSPSCSLLHFLKPTQRRRFVAPAEVHGENLPHSWQVRRVTRGLTQSSQKLVAERCFHCSPLFPLYGETKMRKLNFPEAYSSLSDLNTIP